VVWPWKLKGPLRRAFFIGKLKTGARTRPSGQSQTLEEVVETAHKTVELAVVAVGLAVVTIDIHIFSAHGKLPGKTINKVGVIHLLLKPSPTDPLKVAIVRIVNTPAEVGNQLGAPEELQLHIATHGINFVYIYDLAIFYIL